MANQFYGQHQWCQRRNGAEKMFEIAHPSMFKTLHVVIHERANRTPQRNSRNPCRRFKSRNQADHIADQDENENDCEKRNVRLAVMADDLMALAQHEALDPLERMLQ